MKYTKGEGEGNSNSELRLDVSVEAKNSPKRGREWRDDGSNTS